MVPQAFQDVWYASETRMKIFSKVIVFDDRGALLISPESLEFHGNKNHIQISRTSINGISFTRQEVNWTSYLIVNVVTILFFMLFLPVMALIHLTVILLVAGILSYLIVLNTIWVLIEYRDQDSRVKQAFFADGSQCGWSGIFGGTKRLYWSIRS